MKAIPYVVSGLAWFFIFNACVQINVHISGGAIALSLILAFMSAGWLVYRFETKERPKMDATKEGE